MAPDQLAPVMGRLHQLASDALANHLRPDAEEQRQAAQKVVACAAYTGVLAELAAVAAAQSG
jgi:hypothetical protein